LMLAFACEPDIGSEPEIGWRWSREMCLYADVTVVTDESHRAAILARFSACTRDDKIPKIHFFGPGPSTSRLFRYFGYRGYYPWWMKKVRPFIAALHAKSGFDLMHHVTYSACRYSTAVWGHGVPVIWGPVGGLEQMPFDAIPWSQPKAAILELARNVGNRLVYRSLREGGRQSSLVLASTPETREAFLRVGVSAELMACNGIEESAIAERVSINTDGPLRLVFAGRLLAWKGLALAIRAVAQAPNTRFTIIGDGPFLEPARALARQLGIDARVNFAGPMKRPDLIRDYASHDVLLFPSFHDSGGFAVVEAMANGLPVICLDCGGPAVAVRDGCGVRVPVTSRAEVVTALAAAIRRYDANRPLIAEEGLNASRSVKENYLWSRKAEKMAIRYAEVIGSGVSDF
jgi:glycosyltransferase involved in cell wall biosynthesis